MEKNKAYIITGPTSGIGLATALELAKYGTVVLVGRNREKLEQVQQLIKDAIIVVCDISDMRSVKSAAAEIIGLNLPVAGLLNNAGMMSSKAGRNAQGWDLTFATNHLGAFSLTEALVPHLPDGCNVLFTVSAMENPDHKPVKMMGMKGGRYISAEASAKGEWKAGGAKMPGIDAYATSKQCMLAAALAFARENPKLCFNAIEPGITRGTGLGAADVNAFVHFLFGRLMAIIPPFSRYSSTPAKSAKVIAKVLTDQSGNSGVYYSEKGMPMRGSDLVMDPIFQDRVVAETRALLNEKS